MFPTNFHVAGHLAGGPATTVARAKSARNGSEVASADMTRLVIRGARLSDRTSAADLAIRDGLIEAVGTIAPEPGDEVLRLDGDIVTPGLVNTHHHLYQWATRGYAYDSGLFGWLSTLYPIWARMTPDDVHAAALL